MASGNTPTPFPDTKTHNARIAALAKSRIEPDYQLLRQAAIDAINNATERVVEFIVECKPGEAINEAAERQLRDEIHPLGWILQCNGFNSSRLCHSYTLLPNNSNV